MRHGRFLLLAALAAPAVAQADVPPPPGHVEQCTVALRSRPGIPCRECASTFGNTPDYCARVLGPGYTFTCKSLGTAAWTEVWCASDAGVGAPTRPVRPVPRNPPGRPAASDAGAVADARVPEATAPADAGELESDDVSSIDASALVGEQPIVLGDTARDEEEDGPSGTVQGGCSALAAGSSPLSSLLLVAGLLTLVRRRRAR